MLFKKAFCHLKDIIITGLIDKTTHLVKCETQRDALRECDKNSEKHLS